MTDRSRLRLLVVGTFVVSLMLTLVTRLWFLQVVDGDRYRAAASTNRVREVVTPAVRGLVLDARGRPLLANRSSLVVSVQRSALMDAPDQGKGLVTRLAKVLRTDPDELWGRTQLCGTPGAPKAPACFNGSPVQPVPVAKDVDPRVALQIMERREDFPGVQAELQAVREYPLPLGANAAHLLGYLGPVSDAELQASVEAAKDGRATLQRTDQVGRAGLERQYDSVLRGKPGIQQVAVDIRGSVTGEVARTEPTPGSYLVTSIDAKIQAATEKALADAMKAARSKRDLNNDGSLFKADAGAAVVLDARTGQVVAMASAPSYDPRVWVGGITSKELARLTDEEAGTPLVSRATQGQFAPASTFKVISLPAAVQNGYDLNGRYNCGSSYDVGNRAFKNYESTSHGVIDLDRAIVVSCDTIFYKFAYETWLRQGGSDAPVDTKDPFVEMSRAFGLGRKTGIDLPDDAAGRIPDRRWKREYWEATKETNCKRARTGYPEVEKEDPTRAAFLSQLAKENCRSGWVFRGGDAANFSIGQGDITTTPLQMALVYAAIGNGGTLWQPRVAKAVVRPDGTVVKKFAPKAAGEVPVRPDVMKLLQSSLRGVVTSGTAAGAFAGFPVPVAGKTGTAEVYGKQTTSWFASYAPATNPQYAVVAVVSQGGTGGTTAAPAVRKIYEAIYGVTGSRVDPGKAANPGGLLPQALPTIRPDGTIVTPERALSPTSPLPDAR